MKHQMNSLTESERVASIDILRGIAILGIFLVNMPSFFSPFLYLNPATYWQTTSDKVLNSMVDILAQASFYPLFAFLFGYGAILLAERLRIKEMSFPLVFLRRLFILLVFGTIHAFLVWHGDILITYAVTGLVFMLFYKCKGKTLIITGLVSYLLFWGLITSSSLLLSQEDFESVIYDQEAVKTSIQVYSDGSFTDIMSQRFEDWNKASGPAGMFVLLFTIAPLMLMGAGFAKQKWLLNVKKHKKLLIGLMLFSFIVGMFLKLKPYFQELSYTNMLLQDQFGGPLLALFYITSIVLLLQNKRAYQILKPFSYVGRLSISNYLVQSIVCTTIFYSYGLGLYGKVSFTTGFIAVFIIYSIQVIVSRWWMKKYMYGPVEYLWRWGTYGQRPTFKRISERGDSV